MDRSVEAAKVISLGSSTAPPIKSRSRRPLEPHGESDTQAAEITTVGADTLLGGTAAEIGAAPGAATVGVGCNACVFATDGTRCALEDWSPMSESRMWDAQHELYSSLGPAVFEGDAPVPFYPTSSAVSARSYVRQVRAWLRDATAAGLPSPRDPVYLFEVGGGTGRFALLFLQEWEKLPAREGFDPSQLVYVLSDVSTASFDAWRQIEELARHEAADRLHFALWDADAGPGAEPPMLRQPNGSFLPLHTPNPMAVVLQYVASSLPHDAFAVHRGALYEAYMRSASSHLCEEELLDVFREHRLQASFDSKARKLTDAPPRTSRDDGSSTLLSVEPNRYGGDGELDALLAWYVDHFAARMAREGGIELDGAPSGAMQPIAHGWGDDRVQSVASFTLPVGALRALSSLRAMQPELAVFIQDHGHTGMEQSWGAVPSTVLLRTTVTVPVNLHAMKLWAEGTGGGATCTPASVDVELNGCVLTTGTPPGPLLGEAAEDAARDMGPNEWVVLADHMPGWRMSSIQEAKLDQVRNWTMAALAAVLRTAGPDCWVVHRLHRELVEVVQLRREAPAVPERNALRDALFASLPSCAGVPDVSELPGLSMPHAIGRLLLSLHAYDLALRALEQADPSVPGAVRDTGAALLMLGRISEAKAKLELAELLLNTDDPELPQYLQLVEQLEAELEG